MSSYRTTRRDLIMISRKLDVDFNEVKLDAMTRKMLKQLAEYGDYYCPKQKPRSEKSIGPCEYYMKTGHCICKLFADTK